MKVSFSNTKPCKVTFCNADDGMYDAPYPFDDLDAALAYCKEEIDVRQQAISATIWDADTGEVYATCNWDESDIPEEDYPAWDESYPTWEGDSPYDIEWDDHYWDDGCSVDDVDESNYDPYAGCDVFDLGFEYEPLD